MKSKRTKALEIPKHVKEEVWRRQNGKSVIVHHTLEGDYRLPISVNECCCHVVPRSKGGLGIAANIVGMTFEEHRIFDGLCIGNDAETTEMYRNMVMEHLNKHYNDWREDKVIYVKGMKI